MKGSKLSTLAIRFIEEKYNGYVVNVITSSKSGTADLIACIDGKFFAFEIKGEKDTRKLLQDNKLNMVAKAGGYGGYVYKLADIQNIITNLRKPDISSRNTKISL